MLLERPGQFAEILRDVRLIPAAVEEILRLGDFEYSAPRVALENVDIGGCEIRAGESILLIQGLANRDPRFWVRPDVFSLRRMPNHPLAFTASPYSRLCSPLTRASVRIALEEVVSSLPRIRLAGQSLRSDCRPPGDRFTVIPVSI
ncbi:cytochrome P450 [Streptomyces sp. NPDC051909]|uniref:cytochrome P450 n=1 Tax=Streptomyces sp. NPDC051909 TaxID=3154944 RepID=UPI0034152D55